ncbi:cache domain-containing sensor histidine kinase [Rubrivivax albus]|uniref:histidine kinase n=1 Tax=Rubrivivax albus TaxID=2499835 RepID=A0A3S2TNU4_9BURK|nr:PAS domain S-box protein [Rubrivivax albus]RVT49281.1 PAS domain-containing sensor histidine kinase [Rubrivivax albus]
MTVSRAESTGLSAQGRRVGAVILGGLALFAVLWVAIAGLALVAYRESLSDAESNAVLFARVFAEDLTRDVEATAQATAQLVGALDRGVPPGGPEMRGSLAQMQQTLPWLRGVAVIDDAGLVLASTDPAEVGRRVQPDAFGAWPDAGPARLGRAVRGRGLLDAGSDTAPPGLMLLPLLHAAPGPGPRPLLVVAQINPQALANVQQARLADPAAAAAVLSFEGRLVAATAQVPHALGAMLTTFPAYTRFLPAQESGHWAGDGLRAGPQIVAFRASATQPLLVVVEIGRGAALATWRQWLGVLLGAGAVGSGLIGGLTLVARRSQVARARAQAERDQVQREVSRRERAFDLTLRSVQALIFRTDLEGRLRFVNPHWEKYTGRPGAEAIGRPLWPLVVPAQRAKARALFAADGPRGARRLQAQANDPAGHLRHFDLVVQPLWQDDRLAGFVGSAAEITDLVDAETSLKAQLDFTELLMEHSPVPMSVVDGQGRYARVNRAWEAFTGCTRAQVVGRPVGGHLTAEERREHEAHDRRLHETGEPQRYESSVQHADGSLRDVLVNKVLVPSLTGSGQGVLSVLVDVTDLRRAERATREARDAAEEASRAKSEFIANVSHELRTPLQAIIGFSELGVHRGRAHEKLASMFGDIHAAGHRMLQLVNNLLDVARIESAVGSIHLERTDLRGLVHELLRELEPLLQARSQAVDLSLPEYPLVAKVDPLRLQQVMRNVLANAMKFSSAGARIALQADYNAASEPHLVVRDRGPGIPEAEVETIFEAFAQSSRTKDGSGGTGLGLAICRTIVAAHGGRIWAENLPDGGAAFHILLPARGAAETQPMDL